MINFNSKIISFKSEYSKQIAELFTNSIHKTCNKDYTKAQLDVWANTKIDYEMWEKRLNKTKPSLLISDKILIGFCELIDDYIDCFYIHHDYQKKGLGKELLFYMIKLAVKEKVKILKVDASITANPFFYKYGFKTIKKNEIIRKNQKLINYSMELELRK